LKDALAHAYVFAFFGGVGAEDFTLFEYSAIPIVFSTLIVTVVLMNILIAFLSNAFSKLEEEQKINQLREIGQMLLDLEVIVYFFKYCLTRKAVRFGEYENMLYNNWDVLSVRADPKIKEMVNDLKYTFIFKVLKHGSSSSIQKEKDSINDRLKTFKNSVKSIEDKLDQVLGYVEDQEMFLQKQRETDKNRNRINSYMENRMENLESRFQNLYEPEFQTKNGYNSCQNIKNNIGL
jgi:hypothetical protein